MEKFLTVKQVASLLDVSVFTVRRYIADKKIRAYKFGRSFKITVDDFNAFLSDISTAGGDSPPIDYSFFLEAKKLQEKEESNNE